MASYPFWLSEEAWSLIEPLLPSNQPEARRVDDCRVLSGIFHVVQSGCRWRDCPPEYGPRTTIYNRFNRWPHRKIWQQILTTLTEAGNLGGTVAVDSACVKAHRSAAGAPKNGSGSSDWRLARRALHEDPPRQDLLGRPIAIHLTPGHHSDIRSVEALLAKVRACKRFIADRAYDANALRRKLRDSGIKPVIPDKKDRLVTIRHDNGAYKQRWRFEAAIGRLEDFRRVATKCDKLARTFRDTVALAAISMFWL
jgi:transposase